MLALALALVELLEIVGEAASASRSRRRVRRAHPGVPWRDVVAMRNRLIHGSFDVDLDRVWDTVTDDLPPLPVQLEAVLARPDTRRRRAPARPRPGRDTGGWVAHPARVSDPAPVRRSGPGYQRAGPRAAAGAATLSLPCTHDSTIRPPARRWMLVPGTSTRRPVGAMVRPSAPLR